MQAQSAQQLQSGPAGSTFGHLDVVVAGCGWHCVRVLACHGTMDLHWRGSAGVQPDRPMQHFRKIEQLNYGGQKRYVAILIPAAIAGLAVAYNSLVYNLPASH
jgi:hypothetical protein